MEGEFHKKISETIWEITWRNKYKIQIKMENYIIL